MMLVAKGLITIYFGEVVAREMSQGNDVKLICCILGMTLNSSMVVQGMMAMLVLSGVWMKQTIHTLPCRGFPSVLDGKPPAGKGVDSLF